MKIFFAGCEDLKNLKVIAETGHPHILMSYGYLSKFKPEKVAQIVEHLNRLNMKPIIDSGLFTMLWGSGNSSSFDYDFFCRYIDKYLADLRSYGLKDCSIVECDAHKIIGFEKTKELRKRFDGCGFETIFVWHPEEDYEGLMTLAAQQPYIALPALTRYMGDPKFQGKNRYKTASALLRGLLSDVLKRNGFLPKVHLLGSSNATIMQTHLAFSCDSTSWIGGSQYGQMKIFRNGALKNIHQRSPLGIELVNRLKQDEPERFQRLFELRQSEGDVVNYITAMAYRKYQIWLDTHYQWAGERNANHRQHQTNSSNTDQAQPLEPQRAV